MKNNLTEIIFIIDRSGSMAGFEEDTIGGYNRFLENQRNTPGEAIISTILFDNHFEILHDRVDTNKVIPITKNEYYVRGTTALYDAVGYSINKIGNILSDTDEDKRPSKVIYVIITDGMENASKEFSHHIIKNMIEHQRTKYNWEFIFLGANFDAESFAKSISIPQDRSARYQYSDIGISANYDALSDAISSMRKSEERIDDFWKERVKKEESK